jgi:hypothetical protein
MNTDKIRWNKGDILKIRSHHSDKGKGLSYENLVLVAAESGCGGGWDVYDSISGQSFYGFSVKEVIK